MHPFIKTGKKRKSPVEKILGRGREEKETEVTGLSLRSSAVTTMMMMIMTVLMRR